MGRLIDADKLNRKDVNCANVPMNFIDTAPTVEAIPKDQYENRLKADMVAMLTELQLEIDELNDSKCFNNGTIMVYTGIRNFKKNMNDLIQQKINALKGVEDGNK